MAGQRVLVSIHDVMPRTLPRVRRLVALLKETGLTPATLLVCPGLAWCRADLEALHTFDDEGHALAGHGWRHQADVVRGWRHRLHAALLSRNVAEHLALDTARIVALMDRCHGWFAAHGLPEPALYVPPAWALGPLGHEALRGLPFRWVETLLGYTDTATGRLTPTPLVGYEADTAVRAAALWGLNGVNGLAANVLKRPLRIALHPDDLDLRLRTVLRRTLRSGLRPVSLEQALSGR